MPDRKLRVFLCHASQDKPIVRELYQRLNAEGWIDPWLDEEKLLPGQDWDMKIEKAVEAADAVIVCLSNNSVTKEGYVQRELKFVLDIALEKPEGLIFVLPLRFDDCETPRRLRSWQYLDYFPVDYRKTAQEKLIVSLKACAKEKKVTIATTISSIYTFGNIEFVKIHQGKFVMGSNRVQSAKLEHYVEIPYDYWIACLPISGASFLYSLPFHEQRKRKYYRRILPSYDGRMPTMLLEPTDTDNPAMNISWLDTQRFCDQLNDANGNKLPLRYKFRLPTEAEWEKAAQSNKNTSDVGVPSSYGALMISNGLMWEWTLSIFKGYPYNRNDGREKPYRFLPHVLRGGYNHGQTNAGYVRSVNRKSSWLYYLEKFDSFKSLGFRVVVAPNFEL